jgi:fluoride exporter
VNWAWLTTALSHPTCLVAVGGSVGSIARYWTGVWFRAQPWAKDYFWGTFFINVSGSIVLGIVAAICRDRAGIGFLLFGTGFCGGYTTFSTFSLEVIEHLQRNRWDLALIYIVTSVLAGAAGLAAAMACARGLSS